MLTFYALSFKTRTGPVLCSLLSCCLQCQYLLWVATEVLAIPFLTQLPANIPGRAEDGPSGRAHHSCERHKWNFKHLASAGPVLVTVE